MLEDGGGTTETHQRLDLLDVAEAGGHQNGLDVVAAEVVVDLAHSAHTRVLVRGALDGGVALRAVLHLEPGIVQQSRR
jgi:hypothetical protein